MLRDDERGAVPRREGTAMTLLREFLSGIAGVRRGVPVLAAAILLAVTADCRSASAQPYEVPIYHSTVGGKQNFLIYASVGGGPLVPYLFDTGSPAMFSVYGAWWPGHSQFVDLIGGDEVTFASGTVYHYDQVATDVSVGSRGGRVIVTAPSAMVARITNIDAKSPRGSFASWSRRVTSGRPPIATDGTYGNFGGALHGSSDFGTVLTQFPLKTGLKRGFVVMSGGRKAKTGMLVIGLTDRMIANFRWRLPMAPTGTLLPGIGALAGPPGYQRAQVTNTVVRLERRGRHWSGVIPTVFDTGGGDGTWGYGTSVPDRFLQEDSNEARRRTAFELRYTGRPLLAFDSGDAPARNILGFIPEAADELRINPGILMFYTYDVMFDLDDGFIGLRPATRLD